MWGYLICDREHTVPGPVSLSDLREGHVAFYHLFCILDQSEGEQAHCKIYGPHSSTYHLLKVYYATNWDCTLRLVLFRS